MVWIAFTMLVMWWFSGVGVKTHFSDQLRHNYRESIIKKPFGCISLNSYGLLYTFAPLRGCSYITRFKFDPFIAVVEAIGWPGPMLHSQAMLCTSITELRIKKLFSTNFFVRPQIFWGAGAKKSKTYFRPIFSPFQAILYNFDFFHF